MSLTMLRKYLCLGVPVATRLLAIRRDAKPLPSPERRTVRVPVVSMSALVFGGGRS